MSKILTEEIARANVGKYIDCFSRFGNYPKKIIEWSDGEIALQTRAGVCVTADFDGWNKVYYDYIFTMSEDDDADFMHED